MITFQWKNAISPKFRERYQAIEVNYPWPESAVASILPLATPHGADNIQPESLQVIEILQMYIFSNYNQEKITLPEKNLAVLWQRGKVYSTYSQEPTGDVGSWLQKFSPWSQENVLILIDLKPFTVFLSLPLKGTPAYNLYCHLEVSLAQKTLDPLIGEFVLSQQLLHRYHIAEIAESYLSKTELLLYPPGEVLKNNTRKQQLEQKSLKKVSQRLEELGLQVYKMQITWEEIKPNMSVQVPSSPSPNAYYENAVDQMEKNRLRQSLWDARFAGTKEPLSNTETGHSNPEDRLLSQQYPEMVDKEILCGAPEKQLPKSEPPASITAATKRTEEQLAQIRHKIELGDLSTVTPLPRESPSPSAHSKSLVDSIEKTLEKMQQGDLTANVNKQKVSTTRVPDNLLQANKLEASKIIEKSRHQRLQEMALEDTDEH